MTAAYAVAGILWLSLTAFAVLGGADYGGGVWDLLASGPRARQQREAVAAAMGPVWEANHVWLIFLIVGMFTAFPRAFGVLALALYVPFTVALIGIVLRGAAFAFRAHGGVGGQSAWGVVFGAASIIAPVFLAMAAGAVAEGAIRAGANQVSQAWISPFAIDLGLFAISLNAYLAATYLMVETADRPPLRADFRARAVAAAVASGLFGLLGLALAWFSAPGLLRALAVQGGLFLGLALVNGPIALWAVLRWRPRVARLAVAAQVVFVLWAWALAQFPFLVPPDLDVQSSAAPPETLRAMLLIVGVGMLLLLPSLWFLFRVFKTPSPAA